MKLTIHNYYSTLKLRLKPVQKVLLDYLVSRCHGKSYCFPSQQTIAQDIGVSERSVCRHMASLERMTINNMPLIRKWQKKEPDGKWRHNVYALMFLKCPDMYIKQRNKEILKELQNEYLQMLKEEIDEDFDNSIHSRTPKSQTNKDIQNFSLSIFKQKIQKAAEKMQITKMQMLDLITRISGFSMDPIARLDKYLYSCMKNHGNTMRIEAMLQTLNDALYDDSVYLEIRDFCKTA